MSRIFDENGPRSAFGLAALEPTYSAEGSRTGPLRKPNYTISGLIVVDGSRRRAYAVLQIWSNQFGDTFSSVFGPELKTSFVRRSD